jgi:hypothetical protein
VESLVKTTPRFIVPHRKRRPMAKMPSGANRGSSLRCVAVTSVDSSSVTQSPVPPSRRSTIRASKDSNDTPNDRGEALKDGAVTASDSAPPSRGRRVVACRASAFFERRLMAKTKATGPQRDDCAYDERGK